MSQDTIAPLKPQSLHQFVRMELTAHKVLSTRLHAHLDTIVLLSRIELFNVLKAFIALEKVNLCLNAQMVHTVHQVQPFLSVVQEGCSVQALQKIITCQYLVFPVEEECIQTKILVLDFALTVHQDMYVLVELNQKLQP